MNKDRILVIIGPSGAGKSSLAKVLQDRRLIRLTPSWTTRSPRMDERSGSIEHVFVSDAEFGSKVDDAFFLEEVELFGLSYRYGLPAVEVGPFENNEVPTIMLRAPLLSLLSKHYKNYITYQIEDSYERISGRLRERAVMGEEQGQRLEVYDKEVHAGRQFASRVFVNDTSIEELADRVMSAINDDFRESVQQ
jgi:guanylate kinase